MPSRLTAKASTCAVDAERTVLPQHVPPQPMRLREDLPRRHEVEGRLQLVADFHQCERIGMRGMVWRDEDAVACIHGAEQMLRAAHMRLLQAVLPEAVLPAKRTPKTHPARTKIRRPPTRRRLIGLTIHETLQSVQLMQRRESRTESRLGQKTNAVGGQVHPWQVCRRSQAFRRRKQPHYKLVRRCLLAPSRSMCRILLRKWVTSAGEE
jgi:hypothetical protein